MPAKSTLKLPPRRVPKRASFISAAALAVPVLTAGFAPEYFAEYVLLLWLLAIVPAFLLAYHRGWKGAAVSLAAGMAVLSVSQAILRGLGQQVQNWGLVLAGVVIYAGVALGVGLVTELLHRAREEASELALTDELTEIPNRRYARLFLDKEFEAARRGRNLVVALFDLDRFKIYNDTYGHAAGDDALRTFARALASTTRRMNLSARYGGEEFLSIVSSADVAGALVFAERVRSTLALAQPARGQITVSVGLAAYEPWMKSVDDLLASADRALYHAKADGRDCVRVAEERYPAAAVAQPAG